MDMRQAAFGRQRGVPTHVSRFSLRMLKGGINQGLGLTFAPFAMLSAIMAVPCLTRSGICALVMEPSASPQKNPSCMAL